MDDNVKTAILFSANYIEKKNLILLVPQRIIIGEISEDTSYFEDLMSTDIYRNIDEEIRNNGDLGFYYVKSIKELKKIYNIDDIASLMDSYLSDVYNKMYYYESLDFDNFETCFLKESSMEEFNKKFGLNVSYEKETDDSTCESEEETMDPKTINLANIKNRLDKSILFQDRAKDKLISTLYNNSLGDINKSHIILCGPHGVGKTEMLKQLKKANSNAVVYSKFKCLDEIDASEYINSLLSQLYYEAKKIDNGFTDSVIIIDDVDTVFKNDYDKYYSLSELGTELEKLLSNQNTIVQLDENNNGRIIMDVSLVTFILCGNFNKVTKCVNVPLDFFKSDRQEKIDNVPSPELSDFISQYYLSQEFMNRFDTVIDFEDLSLDKLKQIIINAENSPLKFYCKQLTKQGVDNIEISSKLINSICKRVYSKNGNAKDLNKVIKEVFEEIIVESLKYVGTSTDLIIKDEILEDTKKCYQFKLKNSSQK